MCVCIYTIFIYNLYADKIGFYNKIQLRFYSTDLWVYIRML
jgi:hypothetical protein